MNRVSLLATGAAMALCLLGVAQAQQVTYSYDPLGRLTGATYANGAQVTYAYDAAGNRTQLTSVPPDPNYPVAVADSVTATKNTLLDFDPRANDTGASLLVTQKTDGTHGTVSITGGGTGLRYTPTTGYNGADSFTYTISNPASQMATATVTVFVNALPVAVSDSRSTPVNTALTFDPRTNDTDADAGDSVTITAKTNPTHGSLSIAPGGVSVTYTPTTAYNGPDSFTYTITDSHGGTATANVSMSVGTANQPPDAVNDNRTAQKNTLLSFDPRTNDTDPESNSLTITAISTPAHGSASYTASLVSYTPTTAYTGADSFTYTISDGQGGSDTATVSIMVNAPPAATADSLTTTTSTPATFDPRTNDSDTDGGVLAVTGVGTAGHGTVGYTSSSVTYTPTTDYTGSDSFTYTVSDGQGGTATATVSATVNGGVADGTVLYTKSTGGSFSYTVPAGVSYIDIEVWGAGSNPTFESLGEFGYLAYGGAGGGYSKKHIAVTTGQVIAGSVAPGGVGTGNTTITSPAMTAYTPTDSFTGGSATGGDINTAGSPCCTAMIYSGGGAGNGGGDQDSFNTGGTAPGGGGAAEGGMGNSGRVRITARTN